MGLARHKRTLAPADVGMLMVLLSAVFAGSRPLFARFVSDEGLNSAAIALYQIGFGAVIFGGIGFSMREKVRRNRRAISLAVLSGVGIGLGTNAYFEALSRLPVATVTVIYFTAPAIVIVLESILQRRWPSRMAMLAVLSVLIGCGLIIGPEAMSGSGRLVDYLIAFVSPLAWSILLVTIASTLSDFPAWAQVGFISTGALIPTIVLVALYPPMAFVPVSTTGWWGVFGLVTISGLATQFLAVAGVSRAGSERASIIGVFEMVTAVLIGWWILSEPMLVNQIAGVCFVMFAIFLARKT